MYAERQFVLETWDILEDMNPKIALRWIVSGMIPLLCVSSGYRSTLQLI
jgi:hypothetical protein